MLIEIMYILNISIKNGSRRFRINVPEAIGKEDILTNVKITFYDQNTNDEKDTFKMELCIASWSTLLEHLLLKSIKILRKIINNNYL